jgi:hypothetical protein
MDKPLSKLTKRKKEKIQINENRDEHRYISTDTAEIHKIMERLILY